MVVVLGLTLGGLTGSAEASEGAAPSSRSFADAFFVSTRARVETKKASANEREEGAAPSLASAEPVNPPSVRPSTTTIIQALRIPNSITLFVLHSTSSGTQSTGGVTLHKVVAVGSTMDLGDLSQHTQNILFQKLNALDGCASCPIGPDGTRGTAIKCVQFLEEDVLGVLRQIAEVHGGPDGYNFVERDAAGRLRSRRGGMENEQSD